MTATDTKDIKDNGTKDNAACIVLSWLRLKLKANKITTYHCLS